MSRTFTPLPSLQVQDEFNLIEHLDGELIVGDWCAADVYNTTQSHVMSVDKPGDLHYHVFDYCHPDWLKRPFYERLEMSKAMLPATDNYHHVQHSYIDNEDQLLEFETHCLSLGFEGIMMRDPVGPYKCNRGTFLEGWIYKLKRFEDAEAPVVGIYERMTNNNVAGEDSFGNTKRSHHQENKVGSGMAGGFIVHYMGMELDVAPGNFKHPQLKEIWENKEKYIDNLLKFRFMSYGMKDKPRFIRAVGWRDKIDV